MPGAVSTPYPCTTAPAFAISASKARISASSGSSRTGSPRLSAGASSSAPSETGSSGNAEASPAGLRFRRRLGVIDDIKKVYDAFFRVVGIFPRHTGLSSAKNINGYE